MEEVKFDQVVLRGRGIVIHRDSAVATIGGEGIPTETRSYKTFSSSLTELKEWLIANGVMHVAMESTGVYWKPVYKVLEGPELTVWIMNTRHIQVCAWLQDGLEGQRTLPHTGRLQGNEARVGGTGV